MEWRVVSRYELKDEREQRSQPLAPLVTATNTPSPPLLTPLRSPTSSSNSIALLPSSFVTASSSSASSLISLSPLSSRSSLSAEPLLPSSHSPPLLPSSSSSSPPLPSFLHFDFPLPSMMEALLSRTSTFLTADRQARMVVILREFCCYRLSSSQYQSLMLDIIPPVFRPFYNECLRLYPPNSREPSFLLPLLPDPVALRPGNFFFQEESYPLLKEITQNQPSPLVPNTTQDQQVLSAVSLPSQEFISLTHHSSFPPSSTRAPPAISQLRLSQLRAIVRHHEETHRGKSVSGEKRSPRSFTSSVSDSASSSTPRKVLIRSSPSSSSSVSLPPSLASVLDIEMPPFSASTSLFSSSSSSGSGSSDLSSPRSSDSKGRKRVSFKIPIDERKVEQEAVSEKEAGGGSTQQQKY